MKKKVFIILIDAILYVFFSILYTSKGFAIMLAEKADTLPDALRMEQYRTEINYSEYYFRPISKVLYKTGTVGMILTGIILMVLLISVTYKEMNNLKDINTEKIQINNEKKPFWQKIKTNKSIIIFVIIYAIVLLFIPLQLESKFFSELRLIDVPF